MTGSIDTAQLEKALKSKGFVLEDSRRDHRFYYFYHEGKKTIVRTKISTGSGYRDYPAHLATHVRKQMRLRNHEDLHRFVQCPMSLDEYKQLLRDAGAIE